MLNVLHCTAHMRLAEPPPDCLACKRSLEWPKQIERDAALRRGVERLRDEWIKDGAKHITRKLDVLLRAGKETPQS